MEKKDFDKQVQDLLAGFREDYDPQSWDSFEKKLQFEEEMDELIKSSVESYEEPFNEKHWELLTDEIHRRKKRSLIKRVSEVMIILLLIMTAHNIIQYTGDNQNETRGLINLAALEDHYPQLINSYNFSLSHVNNRSSDLSVQEVQIDNRAIVSNINSNSYTAVQIESGKSNEKVTYGTRAGIKTHEVISLSEDNNHQAIGLKALEITPFDIVNFDLRSPQQDIAVLENNTHENGFWVGLVAGPDVNFINSPFDLNLLKSPIQSQSGTMTLGATISKDFGFLELSSGLLYSNKNYFPFRIREFVPSINQKYLETSLRSLEFEQLQIPLLVNVHTPRSSGWSMYGTLGLGANIITKTRYDIETQVRSFSAAPSSSTGVENLNLRELPRGAFQSGTFGNNVYLSAIAGFGIEKRLNNRYAFSLLTTYQRSLSKEINPVINRTQQLSMSLGVKLNLNK